MSNFGLEKALKERDIPFERTNVGDRYVIEAMQRNQWQLGGENSGHIVCGDVTTTGDGIVAALQVLQAMKSQGKSLHDLKNGMIKYPQVMINVKLKARLDLDNNDKIQQSIREAEIELADTGRVLLRPSGTEPVVRVMVEGECPELVNKLVQQVADVVTDEVG